MIQRKRQQSDPFLGLPTVGLLSSHRTHLCSPVYCVIRSKRCACCSGSGGGSPTFPPFPAQAIRYHDRARP
jgi:hypothetical protein